MQLYTINLTPAAVDDIQAAMDYYNSRSANLGFRFTDEVHSSLQDIATMPKAYGYRYKNIRAKLLYKFPFLVFFIIDDNKLLWRYCVFLIPTRILYRVKNNP